MDGTIAGDEPDGKSKLAYDRVNLGENLSCRAVHGPGRVPEDRDVRKSGASNPGQDRTRRLTATRGPHVGGFVLARVLADPLTKNSLPCHLRVPDIVHDLLDRTRQRTSRLRLVTLCSRLDCDLPRLLKLSLSCSIPARCVTALLRLRKVATTVSMPAPVLPKLVAAVAVSLLLPLARELGVDLLGSHVPILLVEKCLGRKLKTSSDLSNEVLDDQVDRVVMGDVETELIPVALAKPELQGRVQDLVCQKATYLRVRKPGHEVLVRHERAVRGDPRRRHTVLGVGQAGPEAEAEVAEERNTG